MRLPTFEQARGEQRRRELGEAVIAAAIAWDVARRRVNEYSDEMEVSLHAGERNSIGNAYWRAQAVLAGAEERLAFAVGELDTPEPVASRKASA